jgi:hypothetical protein
MDEGIKQSGAQAPLNGDYQMNPMIKFYDSYTAWRTDYVYKYNRNPSWLEAHEWIEEYYKTI